jgi:hypothetical protein
MKQNKTAATREEMIAILNQKYPTLPTRTTEEFYGKKSQIEGIWSSGEKSIAAGDGQTLIDYYASGKKYEFGVHQEIRNLLGKNGWYDEWYDCGTIMFYPI